jgi:hypothetical protein
MIPMHVGTDAGDLPHKNVVCEKTYSQSQNFIPVLNLLNVKCWIALWRHILFIKLINVMYVRRDSLVNGT